VTSYSTHFPLHDPARPERPPILVPNGFYGWGLILGWVALLRPGCWLAAMLAGTATLCIGLLVRQVPGSWALLPGLHLAIGLFAFDWKRWELNQAGFVPGPIVAAPDRDTALLRLLDVRPDLLGPAPAAPVTG